MSECGRTDTVTTVEGRELLFRCDREGWDHDGRHHAVNVEGVEIFWSRGQARSTPAEALDPRDVLLEFGQWLAINLSARRGMEEAFDEDEPDQYVATVDAFLSSLSPHNREAGER